MQSIGLETIKQSTTRLPYQANDKDTVLHFLKREQRNGLIVQYHPAMGATKEAFVDSFRDGVIILSCPQIETDFVCVVEDNGRGLFRGQKRRFRVFLGDANSDDFTPGPSFRFLNAALSSLNNIFRGNGSVEGSIF